MAYLALRDIRKEFRGGVVAVEDMSLEFAPGELTALLGPSGCGKTTLLRMIAGLDSPTRGRIDLGGEDITATPAHARRFGMVFQSFALFPHLNVAENVAYSLAIAGVGKAERRRRAEQLLELVKLAPLASRRIGELSGGQRQRVAIARALAQEPRVFLLDEPMSALDAKLREEMQVELRLLQQKLGITTIVVTHDQREAMTIADRIVVMSHGRAEQVGTPKEIYDRPLSKFVASFIGKANFLDGVVRAGMVEVAGRRLRLNPPASFVDGSPVTVACRPEATSLADARREDANQIPARVTFVRDVGPTREVFLDADGLQLTCEMPSARRSAVALGDPVLVELSPEAMRVFPRETEAA
jgi:putative spermidine/putrescine transport system ATP-binding protein